jgi:predicted GTPase
MMTSLLLCGRSWRTPSDYQEGACIYTTGSGMAEQQGENIPPSNCYRLVLLGSSKVGKTSLVNRFLKNKFEDVYTPTIEDFHRKIYRIKGQAYRLDLLDTSGNHPVKMFNTTFNNISVILWRSALLVEETGLPGEKHRPVASH